MERASRNQPLGHRRFTAVTTIGGLMILAALAVLSSCSSSEPTTAATSTVKPTGTSTSPLSISDRGSTTTAGGSGSSIPPSGGVGAVLGGAIETGQSICDAVALTQVAATSGIAVDTAKATGKTNSGSDTPRCTYTVGTALDKGSVVIDFTPGIGTLESVKRLSPGGKETTTAKFPSYSVTRERLHDQALFVQTAQGVLLVQINPGKSVALAGLDTKVSKLAEQVISSQANK